MAIWRDIGTCRGKLIHALHAYWTAKRAGRAMPSRADIDPAEIKALLPYLLIIDLENDPFRVRYRLLGTKVVATAGVDFTGRYLDEMIAADLESPWEACYRMAHDDREPVYGDAFVPTADGGMFTYEFGIFPLGAEGTAVRQCLAVEDYGDFNDRLFELQDKARPWQPRGVRLRRPEGGG